MIRSLIIAFSMYSRIPMPRCEWNDKSMRYSMCFFPFVGCVLGVCGAGIYFGMEMLGFAGISRALVLTVFPLAFTGGIHMDGYLDTMDAKNSWKSPEEKLEIMKDPHLGAFACICGMIYLFLTAAFWNEVGAKELCNVVTGYTFSRILSALSVVSFRKAKKEGMAAASANASPGLVKWILGVELAVCGAVMLGMNLCYGIVSLAAGGICFWHYRHMAYKTFGGITGDLAGYFLQICELGMLLGIVLISKI